MNWSHEEAKQHSVRERLTERCRAYSPDGIECSLRLLEADWCERCLAADIIERHGVDE